MPNNLSDRFMQRQIEFGKWIEVDGPHGTEFIPGDLVTLPDRKEFASDDEYLAAALQACGDYCQNLEAYTIREITGYGARLSADGYLDCTDWSVFSSRRKALDYLRDIDE